ncbi:MAG: RDD family protein, partial [Burkholderiaceae bacterium]
NTPATFFQRCAAGLIDLIVLVPIIAVQWAAFKYSREATIALLIPLSYAFVAYVIYCHGRYGQTLGKRVMNIRVLTEGGEPLSWRNAWARSSVDVSLCTLSTASMFTALLLIPDALYYKDSSIEQLKNLQALEPTWGSWAATAGQIWAWGELVTMLLNKRRRALHDFIGGTVVVSERALPSGASLSDA